MNAKQPYVAPSVTRLGSIADVTHAGQSKPGEDFKGWSGPAQGPPKR